MPQWTPWRKREVQVQLIIIKVLLHWLLDKWKLQSINMKVKHLWVPFWGCFIITEIENERKITYCPCCCWPDPSWVDRATCSGLQGPFGSICSQHPCYGGSSPIWGVGLRMWEGFQLCPMVTGLWNSAACCLIPRPPIVLLLMWRTWERSSGVSGLVPSVCRWYPILPSISTYFWGCCWLFVLVLRVSNGLDEGAQDGN